MKIEYFDPKPLTKQDEDFMLLLQADEEFEEFVTIARKRANLPPEGVSLTKTDDNHIVFPPGSTELLNQINNDNLYHGVKWILHAYNLPFTWFVTLYSIIVFGIFMRPHRDYHKEIEIIYRTKLNLLSGIPNYGREPNPTDSEPHIVIIVKEGGIKFDGLVKKLKKHKEEIERYLSYLPYDPKTTATNLKIKNRLLELHRQDIPNPKIGEIIAEEFPDIPFGTDHDTVGLYIARHKKLVKSLKSDSHITPEFYKRLLLALSEPISPVLDARDLNKALNARLDEATNT